MKLKNENTLEDIINLFKSELDIKDLRYTGNLNDKVTKVAIINGSGQDFLKYLGI